MKFRCLSAVAAFSALVVPIPGQAKTIELAPSSPWNLHYDDDSCVLRRAFGDETQFFQIELRQFAPQVKFQVAAFGKGLKSLNRIDRYRLFEGEKWRDAPQMSGQFGDDMRGVFMDMSITERDHDDLDGLSPQEVRQLENRI